ncbi:unnamed protein product [Brachionus calyciflorus]|uniref:Uncharacterized protein n=1 Tax=Brachionus calyciflorus TaxID=104777 RepID=A0A814G6T0_9BILA|nr:unnamed protein product [Brachionus calyciflorus]
MAVVNKRIFDTDNALKGSFNGLFGKWQILTYASFVFAYAIIVGWIDRLHDYTLLEPSLIDCKSDNVTLVNISTIQRLSGRKISYYNESNFSVELPITYNLTYGETVISEFQVLCDLAAFVKVPRFSGYLGFILGSILLGYASDRGGRKMIILACIWTTGIMSIFQLVGHDFISYLFFQFFIGLFIGGIQASFLPAIIEMFPINFRSFYGVFFHTIVCIFQLILPLLAKSFKSWKLLQIFVTAPILLTAILQWFVYESIFWYLAHKEYDKAIRVLTKLAKRNGILFESKFKQAKDFLHAKHSKATQVDILPLLRLQDLDVLGKKYPQVDMAELQKQKSNSSKLRRFLNSLKGASYRSTNTIYRPFDFIYSPTLFVYVLILLGLWFTNGVTDSIESVKKTDNLDIYSHNSLSILTLMIASISAVGCALLKFGRRWMIFLAYLVIEVCLLGFLIASLNENKDQETLVTLNVLYYLCKYSVQFGYIFLMLITAELFPTSLRCTGLGLCFALKMIGSYIASPYLLNYTSTKAQMVYCLLTLFFGAMTLFLPETKTFPLPRSILQIEAMPTTIGKKLRSHKVKFACERRQTLENRKQYTPVADANRLVTNVSVNNSTHLTDAGNMSLNQNSNYSKHLINESNDEPHGVYDTVNSVHDIEQDDHNKYYYNHNESKKSSQLDQNTFMDRKLGKIVEVPSKNITRNNSSSDLQEQSKV